MLCMGYYLRSTWFDFDGSDGSRFEPHHTCNKASWEARNSSRIVETTLEAKGAFKGQEVAINPLIGKLQVHVQSFVEPKEISIAPLQSHDVILGAP